MLQASGQAHRTARSLQASGSSYRPAAACSNRGRWHRLRTVTVATTSAAAGSNWSSGSSNSNSKSTGNGRNAQHTQPPGWHTGPAAAAAAGDGSSSNSSSSNHTAVSDDHQPDVQTHPPLLIGGVGSLAAALLSLLDAAAGLFGLFAAQARRIVRLGAKLAEPESRLLLEGIQLGACLLFILLYIWSTYSPVVPGGGRWWCDLVLCLVFAADYTHRIMVASSHPLLAILHPLALIDLLSFAPSLLGAVLPHMGLVAPWGLDLRWFRVFRALRLLRLSLLSGNLSTMKSNKGALISGSLNVPLVWLVASVVAWMFTSASCVAVMEKWVWHDALYFVASTLTTVGYGDVVVKSSMGRLVVLVMMLVGVVLIPVRASQLYSRLNERRLMSGHPPGEAPGCKGSYVVLSGRLSDVRGFNDFLQDFLVQVRALPAAAGQRGRNALQLVCLCNKPSVEFLALQELHEAHLTLVEGSAFSERDLLHRAALAGSAGAIVLADRFSSNAAAEDTDVQFRVWAIKSAVKRVPLYVQVLRRSSVGVIAPFLDPHQDVISSIEGTRMRLLALDAFVPGASTLLANLLRSSGPTAGFAGGPRHSSTSRLRRNNSSSRSTSPLASRDDGGGAAAAQRSLWGVEALAQSLQSLSLSSRDGGASSADDAATMAGRRWLREYADGAHCELFFCPAGPPLAGLRFSNAAEQVYAATGAMLVGVLQGKRQRLVLNPGSYVIKQGQQLVVLATKHQVAEAGAAGEGLERSQALDAVETAVAAAAAPLPLPHGVAGGTLHSFETQLQQQQQHGRQEQLAGLVQQQQQQHVQQEQQQQVPTDASDKQQQQNQEVYAAQSQVQQPQPRQQLPSQPLVQQARTTSRGVTVRIPGLLTEELQRCTGTAAAAPSEQPRVRVNAAVRGSWKQQQQRILYNQQDNTMLEQQQSSALYHQQQQQQQFAASGSSLPSPAAPSAGAAANVSWVQNIAKDVISQPGSRSFLHSSSIDQIGGSAGSSFDSDGSDMSDSDLADLNPCLATWSGAFESDSMDETEVCTDSELLEAALLQRQRQQRREQQQQQQQLVLLGQQQYALQQAAGGQLPGYEQMLQYSDYGDGGQEVLESQVHSGVDKRAVDSSSCSSGEGGGNAPGNGNWIAGSTPVEVLAAIPGSAGSSRSSSQQLSSSSDFAPSEHAEQPQLQQGITHSSAGPSSSSHAHHPQQQQQQQAPASYPSLPPKYLRGHIIMSGCASSFVQFARQLHSLASPAVSPVPLVILHTELPPREVFEAISALGPAYFVRGKSSESAALAAAGAENARSLVHLGPSERPTHLSAQAVSGVYGDPTSKESNPTDYNSTSRTAVLADADALSSCYGVGEVLLPDVLHTVVELGFTSSIRFLQPGLLLHGRSAPHSHGSFDDAAGQGSGFGAGLLAAVQGLFGGSGSSSSSSRRAASRQQPAQRPSVYNRSRSGDYSLGSSPNSSRSSSPTAAKSSSNSSRSGSPQYYQQQQQLPPPHSKLPRSSWRHRKEIEDAGRAEGLTEWQLNSYYAAGRVMVPALLDTFTCQGFFKRRALLDLLTELAGDDGRPGGAMLLQLPVPAHLIGCTYKELVSHFLSAPQPQDRHVALGLMRRKAENRAWRLPYVATHPDPDAVLQMTDAVFVIRPQ